MTKEHITEIGRKFYALGALQEVGCAVCGEIGNQVSKLESMSNWSALGVASFIHSEYCPHTIKAKEELRIAVANAFESVKPAGPEELTVREAMLAVEQNGYTDERLHTLQERLYEVSRALRAQGVKNPVFVMDMPDTKHRFEFEEAIFRMFHNKYGVAESLHTDTVTVLQLPEFGISLALMNKV